MAEPKESDQGNPSNQLLTEIQDWLKGLRERYRDFPEFNEDDFAANYEGPKHLEHRGQPVKVGDHEIHAGSLIDLKKEDFQKVDTLISLISLERTFKPPNGVKAEILRLDWKDLGSPPPDLEAVLRGEVVPRLEKNKKVLVFCIGGHGRTGTFLASLLSILEPRIDDPIAAIRERYCDDAVETKAQAESIFALKHQPLPIKYIDAFKPPLNGEIKISGNKNSVLP